MTQNRSAYSITKIKRKRNNCNNKSKKSKYQNNES